MRELAVQELENLKIKKYRNRRIRECKNGKIISLKNRRIKKGELKNERVLESEKVGIE